MNKQRQKTKKAKLEWKKAQAISYDEQEKLRVIRAKEVEQLQERS